MIVKNIFVRSAVVCFLALAFGSSVQARFDEEDPAVFATDGLSPELFALMCEG